MCHIIQSAYPCRYGLEFLLILSKKKGVSMTVFIICNIAGAFRLVPLLYMRALWQRALHGAATHLSASFGTQFPMPFVGPSQRCVPRHWVLSHSYVESLSATSLVSLRVQKNCLFYRSVVWGCKHFVHSHTCHVNVKEEWVSRRQNFTLSEK